MAPHFSDYKNKIMKYHLYASKASDERNAIRNYIIPLMEKIDIQIGYHANYENENVTELIAKFQESINFAIKDNENRLQLVYFIVDHLLFTPIQYQLNVGSFHPLIADECSKYWNPYVVLHELAVLSWYDQILPSNFILDRLKSYKLNQTEIYHILGEVSLVYPQEAIEFQSKFQILDEKYHKRFIKKLRNSRSRQLQKDVEINLSLDEVNSLIEKNQ